MNERIEELADQAAQEVRMQHNNAYWRMQDGLKEDSAWREKFAELIIKEAFDTVVNDSRFNDVKSVIRAGKQVSLEHFGVK